jgi:hypothetical protein
MLELLVVILILLVWSALTPRHDSREYGIYIEPKGSHDTNPFDD